MNNSYSIEFEQRETYVLATVRNESAVAPSAEQHFLHRIAEHCARCLCTSILIEKHTPEPFAVWDAFKVAPALANIGHEHIRLAVVEMIIEPTDQRELAVAIGAERSLAVQIFTETEAAEQWLLNV